MMKKISICTNCDMVKKKDIWIPCNFCDTKCCNMCVEKIYCKCIKCIKCDKKRCILCSHSVCNKCKIKKTNDKKQNLKCGICQQSGCQFCISTVCCLYMCYNCENDYNIKCSCYGKCESCGCDPECPCYKCKKWLCKNCKCECECEKKIILS